VEVGLGSDYIVLDEDPAAPHRKGHISPPSFLPTALAQSPISATAVLLFTGWMSFLSPKQQCQSTDENT